MTFTMKFDQTVTAVASPVDASGNPSGAQLSALAAVSSDPTIFTVAVDATNPLQVDLAGVKVGSATLTVTATATNADGTTSQVSTGPVTITLTPDVPPAAALVLTFGTPAGPASPAPAPTPAP